MVCDTPYYVLPKAGTEKVPVPCGRCPPCKLRRVNSWVFRMLEEEKISSSSYFVTLTYTTEHVPISPNGFMSLSKRDLQLFFKRLRRDCEPYKLKYYAVGEYGTDNKRPHYHLVIFNVPDTKHFQSAWSLGAIHIGKVTGESIAYTMKYIDKPHSEKGLFPNWQPFVGRDDREKEFPLMSKGLGKNYLTPEMVNYHQADLTRLHVTKEGGHRIALPRYFRQKIYTEAQQNEQVRLIQAVVDLTDKQERAEFHQLYGDLKNYTFEQWKESARYGRYKNFYSQLKKRNV